MESPQCTLQLKLYGSNTSHLKNRLTADIMRYKISVAIIVVLMITAMIAVVSRTNNKVQIQQLNLKTKTQEIETLNTKLESNQQNYRTLKAIKRSSKKS